VSEGDQQFAEFERDGEDIVRRNLAAHIYGERKVAFAKEWLARQDQARRDSSNTEQISIARDASEAAWAAARAAESANRRATIALILAAISIAITFIGLFLKP
jgi:hypothetical protein